MVDGSAFNLLTDSGELKVRREDFRTYHVMMPHPRRVQLDYLTQEEGSLTLSVDAVNVGVPHCVVQIEGLDDIERELDKMPHACRRCGCCSRRRDCPCWPP
jgi:diaminopimelate epimerase